MEFFISAFLILVGFFFLIKGADVFVDGASNIARKFGIPSIIIGLTIVAMGTSLPEMIVSITSALAGKNDMSIANVTGSNLFNICIVLACSSVLMKTKYNSKISLKEKVVSFFRVAFLIDGDITSRFIIIANLILFLCSIIDNEVGRVDGVLLIIGLLAYLYVLIKSAKSNDIQQDKTNNEDISILKQLILMGLGAVSIILGGDLVVEYATRIGEFIGLSENVIGLTIVAMGTSLPELVTSLVAVKKGEIDIAFGNALGSNIINILLVIGLSSLISPIAVTSVALTDMVIALLVTLSITSILFKRDNLLSKNLGIIYILIYVVYTIFAIIR